MLYWQEEKKVSTTTVLVVIISRRLLNKVARVFFGPIRVKAYTSLSNTELLTGTALTDIIVPPVVWRQTFSVFISWVFDLTPDNQLFFIFVPSMKEENTTIMVFVYSALLLHIVTTVFFVCLCMYFISLINC